MYLIILMFAILIEAAVPSTIDQFDEDVEGELIRRTYRNDLKIADVQLACPANAIGYVCADDCQTLLSCHNDANQTPLFTTKCTDVSPNTPYCIPGTGACSNQADHTKTQCIAAQYPRFECTSIGYFPDPLDCSLYHLCTWEVQDTYKCPDEYVFDATNGKCKSKNRCKGCFTIDCTRLSHHYVPYLGHNGYYAFCNNTQITMHKCDDIDHFQFNRNTLQCDFVCKSSGSFPNYKNCHQYYECYKIKICKSRSRNWFMKRLHTCPHKYIFDAKQRKCVRGECFSSTHRPIIPTTTTTTTTSTPSPPLLDVSNEDFSTIHNN